MKKEKSNLYSDYLWDITNEQNLYNTPKDRLNNAVMAACKKHQITRQKQIMASFYPYVGLKSTIKIEQSVVKVRISDILDDAPIEVLESLIHILISKVIHRKPHEKYLQLYNKFTTLSEIESKHATLRKQRSRKKLRGPVGRFYDLREVFQRINHQYFHNQLHKPQLSWSPVGSRWQLGYYDSHLNLIVISKWLDQKPVPAYCVDFIMYHELLHTIVSSETKNGKRIVHTQEFKKKEKEFKYYKDAVKWLNHAPFYNKSLKRANCLLF